MSCPAAPLPRSPAHQRLLGLLRRSQFSEPMCLHDCNEPCPRLPRARSMRRHDLPSVVWLQSNHCELRQGQRGVHPSRRMVEGMGWTHKMDLGSLDGEEGGSMEDSVELLLGRSLASNRGYWSC